MADVPQTIRKITEKFARTPYYIFLNPSLDLFLDVSTFIASIEIQKKTYSDH